MNDSPEEMDACLESQLEFVRGLTYERQPAVAEAARVRFLKEAEKARQAYYQDADSKKVHSNSTAKWWSGLGVGLFPSLARAALAFGIALVVVIGGAAGAVFASQSSLPGDVMYPVKLWGDELRINLSADPAEQLDLEIQIAAERLQEMQQVQQLEHARSQAADGKEVPVAEQAFAGIYKHLDEALLLAQQLYADDPEMLAQITTQIDQQLQLLEDMNPSAIIRELQELRKDLRDQMKESKKAETEPTAENTSVPLSTAAPATVESSEVEVTTEEDVSDTEDDTKDKDKDKNKDKDKETGKDKEKQNNNSSSNNSSNNSNSNNSGNNSSNSSNNNSSNNSNSSTNSNNNNSNNNANNNSNDNKGGKKK